MSRTVHRIYLGLMVITVGVTFVLLAVNGAEYYLTTIEERVYHDDHAVLKPSGITGHGIGIFGSLFMVVGVGSYMARKRYRFMARMGLLKHWLEFHIFLCTLGPLLVLFHTAFKFGGLVAVSFWSMVAVFLSGIAGRFIYLQIPRTIEGRELSLNEVRAMKGNLADQIKTSYDFDDDSYHRIIETVKLNRASSSRGIFAGLLTHYFEDRRSVLSVKEILKRKKMPSSDNREIIALVRKDIRLSRRIARLDKMKELFGYWHVAHLPFALVMLIIMVIHIGVTLLFGYRWIF
ncbi:MAG: hypothetical protein MUC78_03635 [Bacteroidales bacterium]|jgi:hypothetical protein|nr:hypothetical protein [Bacteroidales bacterium]